MKLVARAVTALALLAFATPALPCENMGQGKTAKSEASGKKSATVAKSGAEKKGATPAKASEAKPASATN